MAACLAEQVMGMFINENPIYWIGFTLIFVAVRSSSSEIIAVSQEIHE